VEPLGGVREGLEAVVAPPDGRFGEVKTHGLCEQDNSSRKRR